VVKNNGLALSKKLIFEKVKEALHGEEIQGKSLSFHSPEHGRLSLRKITGILTAKFGALPEHNGKNRLLIFDAYRLDRL
jgi:hypothetical protein